MAMLDFARPGSHLVRHECLSISSSTSFSSQRLSCTGRLPSSSLVCSSSSWAPLVTQVVAGPGGPAHRSWTQQAARAKVASGSVQEEIKTERNITVGQFALQGPRDEMEDEVVVEVVGSNGFQYAAIFDGHAGYFAARFLRDELYKECLTALEGGALLETDDLHKAEEAIAQAFLQADSRLLSRLETGAEGAEAEAGSTATVVFTRSDRLVLAYVGDSRVVLSRQGKPEDLTSDHRPYGRDKKSFAEIKRIQEAGGWVSHGRVCGSLSVSRAFGDIQFKTQKQQMLDIGVIERRWTETFASTKNAEGEWVIALPDTSSMLLEEDAEFIILASDGLWDSLKSTDAVEFVRKRLKEHGDVQRASEEIAKEALMRSGQDNVSVVIIDYGRIEVDPLADAPSWKFW